MIHVVVVLPGAEVQEVEIRRIVGGTQPNDENQYIVSANGREAHFQHRYGDGWMLCVSRALLALGGA